MTTVVDMKEPPTPLVLGGPGGGAAERTPRHRHGILNVIVLWPDGLVKSSDRKARSIYHWTFVFTEGDPSQ